MIPTVDRFTEIAALHHGQLEEIPFPVLVTALARSRRSAVLRLSRKPVEKQIFFVDGVAVDCRSNLVHETLGRFLVAEGKLDESQLQEMLTESLRDEVPLGEVLLEHRILDAMELYRQLRQNLARKLLDPFTWTRGEFEFRDPASETDSTLEVRTPQLVLTGVLKLTPPKQVMGGIQSLLGQDLALHPAPPFDSSDLKLTGLAGKVADALEARPQAIDKLALTTAIDPEPLGRVIYALSLLGVVVPESEAKAATPREAAQQSTTEATPYPVAGELAPEARKELERDVMETFLSFKRKDSFDLLGIDEDADERRIERAYVRFARRFAPWVLEAQGSAELADKARTLFLAGAEAYAELHSTEQRGVLIERRRNLRREKATRPTQAPIETDLLDSTRQYRKGLDYLQSENFSRALEYLQFAADVDPQNALYRAEAAFCRYRISPMQYSDAAYDELREAVRIDGMCGTAVYYLGVLESARGEFETAEKRLRLASRLLAPDRRPIEALKELSVRRKKKRR